MNKILLAMLIACSLMSTAQTPLWQWIKVNGGYGSLHTNGLVETTRQLGTDAYGNIYGISAISSFGTHVDTIQHKGMGYDDFCVFSYRCDGTFRWVKFFGSFHNDLPAGIQVTPNGDVFVSGGVLVGPYGNAQFGDTIIYQNSSYVKYSFIAKLDSVGNIQWLNLPGPDMNMTSNRFISMELDKQGNPVVMAWFNSGAQWNGLTIPDSGHYLLTFNPVNGNMVNVKSFEFKATFHYPFLENFTFDSDNSFYISFAVPDTVILGSDTVAYSYLTNKEYKSVLAKFDSTGQKIWHQVVEGVSSIDPNPDPYQMMKGKPVVYKDYIYIAGETQSHWNSNFLGVPINNPIAYSKTLYTKVIARFNKTTGAFIGAKNFWHNEYISNPLVFAYNDHIYMAGGAGRLIILNQTDTLLPFSYDTKGHPFIVQIDTGLTHFNWGIGTKILTNNTIAEMTSCTFDNNGNIILGGSVSGSVVNSFGDTSFIIGGNTDFFIAKIATTNTNCGCKPADPNPKMVSLYNKVLTVKGTTTIGADSLVWFWGDGTSTSYTQPGTTISHTYQQGGNYTVCLKAWNICGVSDSCFQILNVGVNELVIQNPELVIYPNPFRDAINIELPENMSCAQINLYDLVGKQVLNMTVTGNNQPKTITLNTETLESGIYVIHLVSKDGGRFVGKVVKE